MPTNRRQHTPVELPAPDLPSWLAPVERELLAEMLEAWRMWRLSRRNEVLTIQNDERVVLDFLVFSRGIPGQAQPEHFERWSSSLFEDRQVRPATQRKYQTAVRTFFDFLTRTPRLRNKVRSTLGVDIVQVATPENSVIHRREREQDGERMRSALTDEQTEAFFSALEREIAFAFNARSKSLHALQRDKVMFAVMLDAGLRNKELTQLRLDSFRPNPKFEEFGRYGMVEVYGKGRKWRTVPFFDPAVARLLEWYVAEVRPRFLTKAANDEDSLFLSEQGTRLSPKSLWQRFKQTLGHAGLPYDIVPHCLRHTSVSNDAISGLSIEASRLRRGHAFAATTQTYTHFTDAFVEQEFGRIIQQKLR
jgi:site-specific recombinase XerD